MAVRVPIKLLSEDVQLQIVKDLHIISKKEVWGNNFYSTPDSRDLFLKVDSDVHLPYAYASELSGVRFPNKGRTFAKVSGYEFLYTLRDYQIPVVQESLERFNKCGTVCLNVYPGFGKTVMGALFSQLLAERYSLATLVIVPDRYTIVRAWKTIFDEATTAERVWVFGQNEGNPPKNTQVYIATKGYLEKIEQAILDRVGHLVLDEAHMLCSQLAIYQILRVCPMYITTLTATLVRQDGFHVFIEKMCGEDRIIKVNPKKFYVIKVKTPFTPEGYKVTPRGKMWSDVQKKYDMMPERIRMIIGFVLSNREMKSLILTRHESHARFLTDALLECGVRASYVAGKVKSYKDADTIVGTMSKIGVAFDEKNVCEDWEGRRVELLILDSSSKWVAQFVGRVFRAEIPVIIHPVDNLDNNKRHFRECKKWYDTGLQGEDAPKDGPQHDVVYLEHPYNEKIVWKDIRRNLDKYLMKQRRSKKPKEMVYTGEVQITKGLECLNL